MKQFFTFRRGGKTLAIMAAHIVLMEACGSYTEIYLKNGTQVRVSKNLKYLLSQFSNHDFLVRVHRSWVVNMDLISRLLPGRPCSALLKNGLRIPLGAGICEKIAERLQLRDAPDATSEQIPDSAFCSSVSSDVEWKYRGGDTNAPAYSYPVGVSAYSYTYLKK